MKVAFPLINTFVLSHIRLIGHQMQLSRFGSVLNGSHITIKGCIRPARLKKHGSLSPGSCKLFLQDQTGKERFVCRVSLDQNNWWPLYRRNVVCLLLASTGGAMDQLLDSDEFQSSFQQVANIRGPLTTYGSTLERVLRSQKLPSRVTVLILERCEGRPGGYVRRGMGFTLENAPARSQIDDDDLCRLFLQGPREIIQLF